MQGRCDLKDQIQHKAAFIREHMLVPGRPPAIILGHSIGEVTLPFCLRASSLKPRVHKAMTHTSIFSDPSQDPACHDSASATRPLHATVLTLLVY